MSIFYYGYGEDDYVENENLYYEQVAAVEANADWFDEHYPEWETDELDPEEFPEEVNDSLPTERDRADLAWLDDYAEHSHTL